MSSQRKARAEARVASTDPINFTCGVCKQVHAFDSKDPYKCFKDIAAALETPTMEEAASGSQ